MGAEKTEHRSDMSNGGYDLEGVIWHQFSNRLVLAVMDLFSKDIPVIDFGCGMNFYVKVLNYAGYRAIGVDAVDLGNKDFIQADLTKQFDAIPFSAAKVNVISLEVAEHLPPTYTDQFLDTLTKWNGDVLLSWAIPGQAGIGHINNQSNPYVIEKMAMRGYLINFQKTNNLRKAVTGCRCDWFLKTLMYFEPA